MTGHRCLQELGSPVGQPAVETGLSTVTLQAEPPPKGSACLGPALRSRLPVTRTRSPMGLSNVTDARTGPQRARRARTRTRARRRSRRLGLSRAAFVKGATACRDADRRHLQLSHNSEV